MMFLIFEAPNNGELFTVENVKKMQQNVVAHSLNLSIKLSSESN